MLIFVQNCSADSDRQRRDQFNNLFDNPTSWKFKFHTSQDLMFLNEDIPVGQFNCKKLLLFIHLSPVLQNVNNEIITFTKRLNNTFADMQRFHELGVIFYSGGEIKINEKEIGNKRVKVLREKLCFSSEQSYALLHLARLVRDKGWNEFEKFNINQPKLPNELKKLKVFIETIKTIISAANYPPTFRYGFTLFFPDRSPLSLEFVTNLFNNNSEWLLKEIEDCRCGVDVRNILGAGAQEGGIKKLCDFMRDNWNALTDSGVENFLTLVPGFKAEAEALLKAIDTTLEVGNLMKFDDRRAFISHNLLKNDFLSRLTDRVDLLTDSENPARIDSLSAMLILCEEINENLHMALQKWENNPQNDGHGVRLAVKNLVQESKRLGTVVPTKKFPPDEIIDNWLNVIEAFLAELQSLLKMDKGIKSQRIREFWGAALCLADFLQNLNRYSSTFWEYFCHKK